MIIKYLALAAGTSGPSVVSPEAMQRIADDLRTKGKISMKVNDHKVDASVVKVEISERGLEVTLDLPETFGTNSTHCSCGEDISEGPNLPHKTTCPKA